MVPQFWTKLRRKNHYPCIYASSIFIFRIHSLSSLWLKTFKGLYKLSIAFYSVIINTPYIFLILELLMSSVITLCMDCFFFPATMDLMKTLDGDQLISRSPGNSVLLTVQTEILLSVIVYGICKCSLDMLFINFSLYYQ